MNKRKPHLSFIFILLTATAFMKPVSAADEDSVSNSKQTVVVGLRFQKAMGHYWSNGIAVEYTSEKIAKGKISVGFNFISSSLGTALNSNAIPFYEVDVSAINYFRRSESFKPLLRLNVGYAHANYGSDIFKNIPNQSLLLSIEAGAAYDLKIPLRIALSGGYNLITGNGEKGLGVIFPIYAQCSFLFRMFPR